VYPQSGSLEQRNEFTLGGKSIVEYLVLGFSLVLPLFTLAMLVICIRTRLKGRKWPWILFVICGFGRFAVNWTTGQWDFSPLYVQLFSAGAYATRYGPWTISISIPVGAIIFLLRGKQLKAADP
jgi:hypothetical protein